MKLKSKGGMKRSPASSTKTIKSKKIKGKLGGIASKLEGKLFSGGGPLGGPLGKKSRRASISGPMNNFSC